MKSKCSGTFWFYQTNWTRKASPSQGRNLSLNGRFCHQKVIQSAWVLHRYHSLNKIGEGRVRDLTGDIPFPVTSKCPVQRPSKDKILAEAMTQFPIHIEHKNTSLQLSGPFWINNYWSTPGVVILSTRLGLLNMILSSPPKMVVEVILQNVRWSPLGTSAGCSSMFFLLISKAWTWKWRCIFASTFIAKWKDCSIDREYNAIQNKEK